MMYKVFLSIVETFIAFGFGALAWRLRMIKSSDLGRLTRLTLDMFFPMLTFSTITRNFDPSQLNELWVMPLLGIAIMAVGALAGWYLKRFLRWRTPGRLGTFHHICAINNYVFLPIIILQNNYSERHVALLLLMNVGSTVGFWTIGVMTFTGGGSVGQALRKPHGVTADFNVKVVLKERFELNPKEAPLRKNRARLLHRRVEVRQEFGRRDDEGLPEERPHLRAADVEDVREARDVFKRHV